MKFLTSLLFLLLSLVGYAQSQDTLVMWADTCSSAEELNSLVSKVVRRNAWSNLDRAHAMIAIAKPGVFASEDSTEIGTFLREHGILHAIRQDHDSAKHWFEQALLWQPKSDSGDIGYLYRNLCVAHRQLENYSSSLNSGYLALRYLDVKDSVMRPLTYLEMAKTLYKLQDYELSYEYAQKSLDYFESTGDLYNQSSANNSIGLALMELDTMTNASIQAFRKSNSVKALMSDTMSIVVSLANIGISHYQLGNNDSALYYLKLVESKQWLDQTPYPFMLPMLQVNLSSTYMSLDNWQEAERYAKLAYEGSKDASTFVFQRACHNLYKVYNRRGDVEKALSYYVQFHKAYEKNIKVSNDARLITNEQDVREQMRVLQLEMLQKEHLLEKAENEKQLKWLYIGLGVLVFLVLTLLQMYALMLKKRRVSQEALLRLNQLDDAKNRLFSIIGHDLRGPIGNSLFLLKEIPQRGDKLSADSADIMENVRQGLAEVNGLLENLLIWAKDQATELKLTKTEVNINSVVHQCEQIMTPLLPNRRMKMSCAIDEGLTWNIDPNAYSTIIRNLVSNALKYAPTDSEVVVSIHVEEGVLITRVKDSGPGIPREVLDQLKNLKEYRPDTSKGMGLYLVYMLTKEHGGDIEVAACEEGSYVEVRIP
ncbi:tetratricopeptide repeat-containing sensor histidine kinase [Phaeocystidibacter luteus]|uniref:histidine kinase n=1 Tax=Phaeocystidibacter luteus TaxID=911197 RepID=A0A6N6RDT4_9FLAO|nr:HAMP domain-containing sensor histidine kinase [Phaeocystidibacter luteus]KAB2807294.1 HAMP domain-containing histidine kinase [Phaeocystidibacter luteus]